MLRIYYFPVGLYVASRPDMKLCLSDNTLFSQTSNIDLTCISFALHVFLKAGDKSPFANIRHCKIEISLEIFRTAWDNPVR